MKEGKRFQLGGRKYHLSIETLAKAMRDVAPKPLGKYCVLINGLPYAPKQVICPYLG